MRKLDRKLPSPSSLKGPPCEASRYHSPAAGASLTCGADLLCSARNRPGFFVPGAHTFSLTLGETGIPRPSVLDLQACGTASLALDEIGEPGSYDALESPCLRRLLSLLRSTRPVFSLPAVARRHSRPPYDGLEGSSPAAPPILAPLDETGILAPCSRSDPSPRRPRFARSPRAHLCQRHPHHPIHLLRPPTPLLQDPDGGYQMTTHGAKRIKRPVA